MMQPYPPVHPSANTARSYAIVGLIFYILATVFDIFGFIVFPVFGLIWLLLSIGLTAWAVLTFSNIEKGHFTEAHTASLVLGILGIFFGFLIGGIFFLLAYGKLGDLIHPQPSYGFQPYPQTYPPPQFPQAAPAPPQPSPAFNPMNQRFCVNCGRPLMTGTKFCPNCGKEVPP